MACRRCEISTFMIDNGVYCFFMTATWLSAQDDEAKRDELSPSGFDMEKISRQSRFCGGGIAAIDKSNIYLT